MCVCVCNKISYIRNLLLLITRLALCAVNALPNKHQQSTSHTELHTPIMASLYKKIRRISQILGKGSPVNLFTPYQVVHQTKGGGGYDVNVITIFNKGGRGSAVS